MLKFSKKVNVTLRNLPELGLKLAKTYWKMGILLSKFELKFVQEFQNKENSFQMVEMFLKPSNKLF